MSWTQELEVGIYADKYYRVQEDGTVNVWEDLKCGRTVDLETMSVQEFVKRYGFTPKTGHPNA